MPVSVPVTTKRGLMREAMASVSASVSTMRPTSASVTLSVREMRRRAVPSGTVGGRIGADVEALLPAAAAATATARASWPTITGWICEPETRSRATGGKLLAGEGHELGQTFAPLGLVARGGRGCPHGRGDQRRGRRRIDEGPAAVDEEVAELRREQDERAHDAERLAAGVERDHVGAAFEGRAKPAPAGAPDTGRVRLVDDEEGLVALGDGCEIGERRAVAVHANRGSRRRSTAARCRRPSRQRADRVVEGLDVVVACGCDCSALPARMPS